MDQQYEVTPQDRMNYLLNLYSADQQINAVLYFSGEIKEKLLEEAVKVTLKIEPVLNSRFIEAEDPYWQEQSFLSPVCRFEDGTEEEIEQKLRTSIEEPGDRMQGPMVQTTLFRSPSAHILAAKLSHLCSDGSGVKEYIQLLAAVYTRLSSGESKENIIEDETSTGFRGQSAVFEHAGVPDPHRAYRPAQDQQTSLWSFPSKPNRNEKPQISLQRMNREKVERLNEWAKARQATLNDVFLSAYFRALSRFAVSAEPQTAEKMVGVTVDLRRYLPNRTTGAISNLSGMEMPMITLEENDSFEQTLANVKQTMDTIKSQQPGLSSAAGMLKLADMKLSAVKEIYKQQHDQAVQMEMALPLLTNFGVIAEKPIRFGTQEAVDGYMTSPIMYAPFFTMGVSSYNGKTTFTIGYHTPDTSKENVNLFLDHFMQELP